MMTNQAGGVAGGAIGAVIGHQMDQQAKKIEQQVGGATVERVGEGIQVTFASGLLFDFDSDAYKAELKKGGNQQQQKQQRTARTRRSRIDTETTRIRKKAL